MYRNYLLKTGLKVNLLMLVKKTAKYDIFVFTIGRKVEILVVGLFIAAYDLYVITTNPVYIEQFID